MHITSHDNLRISYEEIKGSGLFSFYLLKPNLHTFISPKDSLLKGDFFYFSPRFHAQSLSMQYNVYWKISEQNFFKAKYTIPIFDNFSLNKTSISDESYEIYAEFVGLPLKFFLGLRRYVIPFFIERSFWGDLQGSFYIKKTSPFDQNSISSWLKLDFPKIRMLFEDKNMHLIYLKSFQTEWNYQSGALVLSRPVEIRASNYKGFLRLQGLFRYREEASSNIEFQVSGEGFLFHAFKKIFQCPLKKNRIQLRGFEKIQCF